MPYYHCAGTAVSPTESRRFIRRHARCRSLASLLFTDLTDAGSRPASRTLALLGGDEWDRESVDVGDQLIISARTRGVRSVAYARELPANRSTWLANALPRQCSSTAAQLIDELVASLSSEFAVRGRQGEIALTPNWRWSLRSRCATSSRTRKDGTRSPRPIQFKILESERRLRSLLEALAPPLPASSDRNGSAAA